MTAPAMYPQTGTAGSGGTSLSQQTEQNIISKVATSVWNSLTGGAKRDADRQARADAFGNAALHGSIIAARYVLGGITNTASHESPMYSAWKSKLEALVPELMQQAEAAGPLWDVGDTTDGHHAASAITDELQGFVDGVKTDASKFVQRAGSGAVDYLSGKIAPAGSAQSHPVTIPTNMQTIVLIVLAVVIAFFFFRRR